MLQGLKAPWDYVKGFCTQRPWEKDSLPRFLVHDVHLVQINVQIMLSAQQEALQKACSVHIDECIDMCVQNAIECTDYRYKINLQLL